LVNQVLATLVGDLDVRILPTNPSFKDDVMNIYFHPGRKLYAFVKVYVSYSAMNDYVNY